MAKSEAGELEVLMCPDLAEQAYVTQLSAPVLCTLSCQLLTS